jgi:hypothetical protein
MCKELTLLAAVATVFAFLSYPVSAAPIAALKGVTQQSDKIQQVAQGCGRYWHRNRYGRCVPN